MAATFARRCGRITDIEVWQCTRTGKPMTKLFPDWGKNRLLRSGTEVLVVFRPVGHCGGGMCVSELEHRRPTNFVVDTIQRHCLCPHKACFVGPQ